MNQKSNDSRLFSEFSPVPTKKWEEQIHKDLKGADYRKKLIWNTPEGFEVKPYYRSEDLEDLNYLDTYPGDYPFTRGNKAKGNSWRIRQEIPVNNNDIKQANKKALDILMKGIDSLGFVFRHDYHPTTTEIERLMDNIYAEAVEINFINGDGHKIVAIVEELAKKYNRNMSNIYGSVDYDPIGHLIKHGKFCLGEDKSFEHAGNIINATEHLPNFDAITVHADRIKNAGSTIIQELGYGLAMGADYLTRLTERGLSIDDVAPKIRFNFATGPNYFMEIAKVRAAKLLWANIVNAYGPKDQDITRMTIHSTNATWNKTIYDPYVNMLRTTTETMSSTLGGVNSFTVLPFNAVYEEETEFSERIARNQQLLIKEEAYMDKVADPAAGSYYIENLTDSIAGHAWDIFLQVMDEGGFVEAYRNGSVRQNVNEAARKRDMNIATRRETLLGTNQYPNFTEYCEKELDPEIFEVEDETLDDAEVETLKSYRGAQEFERLRYHTDQHARDNHRPRVFMLTYGNLAMRRARSQFSSNFFACAGYEIIDNNGFDSIEEGVEAAIKANSDIVVLCSSDEEYADIAPKAHELLKNKAIMVVAGYPKDAVEDLQKQGIKNFIHLKTNVLETLKGYQRELGIES